jgi:hypothetical protein
MKRSLPFLIAILAACAGNTTAPGDAAMTLADGRPAVRLVDEPDRFPHDAYQFVESSIRGDTLTVTVQHGGGCATHEYALLVRPVYLESYPVQMHGSLAHDAKGDPCRALLRPTLRFDLTPIKQAYRRAYSTTTGEVALHIAGWPQPVRYRF